MQEETKPEVKAIEKRLKVLADITGRVVAPLVGLITAGPIGAIAGGVVGTVIKYGMEDFLAKYLTPKEVQRVGTSIEYIITNINKRLEAGSEVNENFFENKKDNVSDAEELFEGVLLKSKNEYQSKKLKYISEIFANASFDKSITPDNVNQVLNIADRLSYRQICLIALIGKNTDNKYNLRTKDNRGNYKEIVNEDLLFLNRDLGELNNFDVIHRKDNSSLGNYIDPAPEPFRLYPLGIRIFQLMNLQELSDEEFTFIKELQ